MSKKEEDKNPDEIAAEKWREEEVDKLKKEEEAMKKRHEKEMDDAKAEDQRIGQFDDTERDTYERHKEEEKNHKTKVAILEGKRWPGAKNGGKMTDEEWKKSINYDFFEDDDGVFDEVVDKIWEDNNIDQDKVDNMSKESTEKWVRNILGGLLQGEDDKKDPYRDAFNELWEQWASEPDEKDKKLQKDKREKKEKEEKEKTEKNDEEEDTFYEDKEDINGKDRPIDNQRTIKKGKLKQFVIALMRDVITGLNQEKDEYRDKAEKDGWFNNDIGEIDADWKEKKEAEQKRKDAEKEAEQKKKDAEREREKEPDQIPVNAS